ncbi:non-specific serine/threonine protein kinase [Malassezia sp. CBS 17886]|nr:non-specific serine/threonine protein kinase [Malassezia sp. CBS 17886]
MPTAGPTPARAAAAAGTGLPEDEAAHVRETNRLRLKTHAPSGRRMVNQYVVEDEIGHGVHGRVRLARDAETGERVAVKIVLREMRRRLGSSVECGAATPWVVDDKVRREIAILKKCSHQNVVQLKEVIDDPHSRKIFMILEYMHGGEVVWKDAMGRPTMAVDEARATVRDVVLGLEFLHCQGIIHRDIKPANLLWDATRRVKISDFGVSHVSMVQQRASLENALPADDEACLAKTVGSPAFFAPELCMCAEEGAASQPCPPITQAIDIWALGVSLYCLLFGHLPFDAESEYALFAVIPHEDYALPDYMGADRVRIGPRTPRWGPHHDAAKDVPAAQLSHEAQLTRDLLDGLLQKDPRKRITLDQVKQHPWLVYNMPDASTWLRQTDPARIPSVQVSAQEVDAALTGFTKFKQRMQKLQSMLAGGAQPRRVRPPRLPALAIPLEPGSPGSLTPSDVSSTTSMPASPTSAVPAAGVFPAAGTSSSPRTSSSISPIQSFTSASTRLLRNVPPLPDSGPTPRAPGRRDASDTLAGIADLRVTDEYDTDADFSDDLSDDLSESGSSRRTSSLRHGMSQVPALTPTLGMARG